MKNAILLAGVFALIMPLLWAFIIVLVLIGVRGENVMHANVFFAGLGTAAFAVFIVTFGDLHEHMEFEEVNTVVQRIYAIAAAAAGGFAGGMIGGVAWNGILGFFAIL